MKKLYYICVIFFIGFLFLSNSAFVTSPYTYQAKTETQQKFDVSLIERKGCAYCHERLEPLSTNIVLKEESNIVDNYFFSSNYVQHENENIECAKIDRIKSVIKFVSE